MQSRSLVEKAEKLVPLLKEESAANEARGALTDRTVAALRDDGFFGIFAPVCAGGSESQPTDALKVIETLSYGDASAGWVTFACGTGTGTGAAFLPDAGFETVFGHGKMPWVTGSGVPAGTAVREKNGYRLSGKWSYGSGVKHAEFIHTAAIILENGAPKPGDHGLPEVRIFVTPRQQVTFGDNWDVLGLRATGSIDYTMSDVFVPEEMTHLHMLRKALRGGLLYSLGIIAMAIMGHTAFALGVGRRALDELSLVAESKAGLLGKLGDSEHFQEGFGRIEAQLRAARAFAYDTWGGIERGFEKGCEPTTRQQTLLRLALAHATMTSRDVCDFAYNQGGGVALRGGAIQRCFRDMRAGAQHITSSAPIVRECGRELAGLARDTNWVGMKLA